MRIEYRGESDRSATIAFCGGGNIVVTLWGSLGFTRRYTERTCWEGEPPPGEKSETIEVGVCLLTVDTLSISKPRRIFIKPTQSSVSDFCTKLTGITPGVLEQKGVTRAEAWRILASEFKLQERVWAGWAGTTCGWPKTSAK